MAEWKTKNIEEFLTESRIKGNSGDVAKKITVKLWNKGVFEKQEIRSGSENTQYYIRKAGQLIYSKLDFLNCAFGIIPQSLDGYETTLDLPCFDIKGINPQFLLYIITQKRFYEKWGIISANGGRKARRISPEDFLNMPIPVPPIEEQEKIAEILSTQDKLIELKQKLIDQKKQQKKWLMQNLLTGKIRLKGFSGEWKKVKLSKILKERKEKNSKQNLEIYSVSVIKGIINQIEHMGRSFAAKDTSKYNIVKYGDVIYTKSPTGDFPYGIIKQSQVKKSVAVSPLYAVYEPINYYIGYILNSYFESSANAFNYLIPIVQKGAKNTINISNNVFISNSLYLPLDENEQIAIAEILSSQDKEIELLEKQLEQEKLKKKALMQLLLTGKVRVI